MVVIDRSTLTTLLKDGPRKKVLSVLSEVNGEGVSFKELSSRTEVPPTTLAYHLKVLTGLSLVRKGLKERADRRDYSSYTLTDQGSKALTLFASLVEQGPVQKEPLNDQERLPELLVTYMTIGPRCMVLTEGKR